MSLSKKIPVIIEILINYCQTNPSDNLYIFIGELYILQYRLHEIEKAPHNIKTDFYIKCTNLVNEIEDFILFSNLKV